ncbi:endocuticle structural glycoprotein SgAbd-5-like [Zerene cesonia]|uniref:endocuticle structural glycoprotein SgAbd-5-like n=1 Tax=Zerene cesonia TaxID=33412 RepID=UPI0018E4DB41|nr:endocuticle structural glycoprotein SgAbd-5-like [Zerene cesonia]
MQATYCVFFACFFTAWNLISAAPLSDNPPSAANANIIQYENNNDGSGNYKFSFETSDGTKREETGTVVNPGQPDEHIAVVGSYSFIRSDGFYETVEYKADENGYNILTPSNLPEMQVVQALPNAVVASLLG